jgi:rhodanese-related sulfurtransferase
VAHPSWRASSVGVYRLWRDLGYAIGALIAGITADALGLSPAMWLVAAMTFSSGLIVAVRMKETLKLRDADAMSPPTCVSRAELHAKRHGAVVVDVRSREEFEAAHVEGAVNIPLEALDQRAAELPKNALIVTVCGKGGGRSDRAAALLRSIGFASARSLCGGTQGWLEHVEEGA